MIHFDTRRDGIDDEGDGLVGCVGCALVVAVLVVAIALLVAAFG